MKLIANAADRLLGAIVPRATADAWSCPPGCVRQTCNCTTILDVGSYWYDRCVSSVTGAICMYCTKTVWTC